MSANRLFQIINILLGEKTVTATELSKRLEVSVRTVYRDIDTLSQAGIPVYTTQGKGGGISLLDNFVLDKSLLSSVEQEQILMSLKNISQAFPEVDNLRIKMKGLFQKSDSDWVEVDLSRWGYPQKDKEKFNLLRSAITQKNVVTFSYFSSYGEKTFRTVKPAKLVFKAQSWYLQAFCTGRKDYRTFKINRISVIEVKDTHFTDTLTPPPIDDGTQQNQGASQKLKFDKSQAYRIYDEFDESDIAVDDEGNFIVMTQMPEDAWLYGFLLSFGASVQVLEPIHIKHRLATHAEKIFYANRG